MKSGRHSGDSVKQNSFLSAKGFISELVLNKRMHQEGRLTHLDHDSARITPSDYYPLKVVFKFIFMHPVQYYILLSEK